jgi:hypothetical protein
MIISVSSSILCLTVLLFLSSSWSVLSKPLKIYVHIGTLKTGSTHIQSYIESNWQNLENENICIPSSTHSAKSFAPLVTKLEYYAVDTLLELPEFQEIQKCLKKKMNVVISSENFSILQADKVMAFKAWLEKASQGHEVEVKVILYYREWLNFIYSLYFEHQKKYETGVTTFSEHFAMNNITKETDSYEFKAQNYLKAFGKENLIIVDYYGVEAAKKDVAYVFVCEIMGVYCRKAAELNNGKAGHENSHLDLVYMHYFYLWDLYLNSHFMRRCTQDTSFLYWEIGALSNRKIKFPTKVSYFDFYRPSSIDKDKKFHEKYQKNFLYGNHGANVQKIHDFHVDEMDVIAFYRDPKWVVFMREETLKYIKKGIICALDNDQVKIGAEDMWKLRVHDRPKKPHGK